MPGDTITVMAIESDDPLPQGTADECLVRATLAGDNHAYGCLYDRYARMIRAVCYDTTREVPQAEDLCQEAFLQAFRKLDRLRKPERFGPWLVTIARHTCRNWLRRHVREARRKVETDLSAVQQRASMAGPADEDLMYLHSKLLELPEKERLALQMCYLCEEPHEQARSVLGLSRSGLYAVLERAKHRLRRLMGARGKGPSDE